MSESNLIQSPLVQIDLSWFAKAEGIEIKELSFRGHINLRGRPENPAFFNVVSDVLGSQPPLDANTFTYTYTDDLKIYWLGPDEWLIVTAPDQQAAVEEKLREALAGVFSSITDVSSGQTIIQLTGKNARTLLQKSCTIDLHPREFKTGDCAQTRLAKTAILLSMVDEVPSYDIIVRRSFSDYLGLWLLDSAKEFVK